MSVKLASSREMAAIDHESIENYGFPSLLLMENAGRDMAEWVASRFGATKAAPKRILVIAGSGNNGGDGLVAARHLSRLGFSQIHVLILSSDTKLSPDNRKNLDLLAPFPVQVSFAADANGYEQHHHLLSECDIILDAIFGTGLSGPIRGFRHQVIQDINALPVCRIGLDIPSGLICDADTAVETAVHCDYTLTVGLPKLGMADYPGASFCGEIFLLPNLFPKKLTHSPDLKRHWLTAAAAADLLPQNSPRDHKGSRGSLLIIGGSRQYPGAALLAARGGKYSACGLTRLFVPESVGEHPAFADPDLIAAFLPATAEGTFGLESLEASSFQELCASSEALTVGPGLGRGKDAAAFFRRLLSVTDTTKRILDADALFHLATHKELLDNLGPNTVLTPHIGEMARLLHISAQDVLDSKEELATEFARKYNLILVLKDAVSLIADPEGHIWYVSSGDPAMARGGMGDVLCGYLGGLAARGMRLTNAALLAVYTHGLAGSLLARELDGPDAVTASRLAAFLPRSREWIAGGQAHPRELTVWTGLSTEGRA